MHRKFHLQKLKIFRKEKKNNSDFFFHISAQNIDCGYPQAMFSSKNKKNNVYSFKPQFYLKSGV